jgi:hypothetical protein
MLDKKFRLFMGHYHSRGLRGLTKNRCLATCFPFSSGKRETGSQTPIFCQKRASTSIPGRTVPRFAGIPTFILNVRLAASMVGLI